MAYVGTPDAWADLFPDYLIPEILDLMVSVWDKSPKPSPGDLEVSITRRFRADLIQEKALRSLPFLIDREIPEDNLYTKEEIGRIDLRFTHGNREDVYLAFECKRLCLPGKTLAAEYVINGMKRFVTGQYASKLEQGGMIGYVMNGTTSRAIEVVQKQVKRHCSDLCMQTPGNLEISSVQPKDKRFRESQHSLPTRNFTLHHIFLSL